MDEDRLEQLERRIGNLERRVDALHGFLFPQRQAPPPEPRHVVAGPPPQKQQPGYSPPIPQPTPLQPIAVPVATSVTAAKPDTEYKIGAQVLPRVGAVVFLLGILYLVGLGISRGWITIRLQWYGELALCAGFIIAGLIKRNEKEDFGQILTAIGSCGLYFSFAGANVFKFVDRHPLISGESLVLAFMALSFANLGFSWWRASKTFLVIGVLGGLVGALLPLREFHLILNSDLQLAIVVAAALIIGRYRWFYMAIGLTFAAALALLPGTLSNFGEYWPKLAFLYVNALICLSCLAYTRRKASWDPQEVLIPLLVFATGCLGFAVKDGLEASAHVSVFALAIAALGLLFYKDKIARNRLWMGSVIVMLLLAPAGYPHGAVAIYGAVSILLSAFLFRSGSFEALFLAWTEVIFALVAYMVLKSWDRNWQQELGLDGLLALTVLSAGYATLRKFNMIPDGRTMLLGSVGMLASAFLLRIGYLAGIQVDPLHRPWMTQAYSGLVLSLACGLIGLRRGSPFRLGFGISYGLYGAICYLALVSEHGASRWEEMFVLGFMAALCFLLGKNARDLRASDGLLRGILTPLLAAMFLQAVLLMGLPLDPGHRYAMTQAYAGIMASFVIALLVLAKPNKQMPVYAWLLGIYGAAWYCSLFTAGQVTLAEDLTLLWVMIALTFILCISTLKIGADGESIDFVGGAILWALFCRMAFLVLTMRSIGMGDPAAITIAWTLYAVILIGVGFVKHRPVLRYMSLALFAATVAKVVLYDLAALDPGIRVGVLMLLGLAMIGGGYWYIRVRKKVEGLQG